MTKISEAALASNAARTQRLPISDGTANARALTVAQLEDMIAHLRPYQPTLPFKQGRAAIVGGVIQVATRDIPANGFTEGDFIPLINTPARYNFAPYNGVDANYVFDSGTPEYVDNNNQIYRLLASNGVGTTIVVPGVTSGWETYWIAITVAPDEFAVRYDQLWSENGGEFTGTVGMVIRKEVGSEIHLYESVFTGGFGDPFLSVDFEDELAAEDWKYLGKDFTLQQVSDNGGFDNGSTLQEGNRDNGFGGGISQVCTAEKELQWENGVQYFLSSVGGTIVYANSINNVIPDTSYDTTQGWAVGSKFNNMVTGTTYVATDVTEDSAVWEEVDGFLPLSGGSLSGAVNDAKGTDIASAATTDIGASTGNYVVVTGTTTITALGTVQAGTERVVGFEGALILTHNATSLILPTAANITTAAGDVAVFVSEGSGNWRCTGYLRANGQALAGGSGISDGDKGDITVSSSGATWSIDNAAVTLAKIQNVAANTFLANATGSPATVQEIATNRIPLFASTITGTPSGTTFLRGDGSWVTPAGSGDMTLAGVETVTGAKTFNNATLKLRNAGNTQSSTLATAATASRTYTIPEAGAAADFVMTEGAQTVNGLKTFASAIVISGSTGSVPVMVLTPTSAVTITGTTNGSIWCDTVSSNTSLTMRKDSGYTKIITAERNPDFATGSSSGLLVADTSGNLTKTAGLTALGVFAQTSSVTVADTATSTTLLGALTGSATLPADFFGVGKTIKIYVSGTYSQDTGSQTCALKLTIGGVAVGTITFTHSGGLTNVFFDAEFTLTCRTTGATGTLQFMAIGRLNHSGTDLLNFFQVSATSGSIDTTGTLAIDLQADWVNGDLDNSITASIVTTTFLN